MHIKFGCIGHRCKLVQTAPDTLTLYVEDFGSTTYKPHWSERQVRVAVAMVAMRAAMARAAKAIAPSCPECGRGTFDGRDCHECGYFTH